LQANASQPVITEAHTLAFWTVAVAALVLATAGARQPAESLQGVTGISPEATPFARRLRFDEARETVLGALKEADAGVRLGAVRSLGVFGAPAAPYVQVLRGLSDTDPDAEVRAGAWSAIEAIRREGR